MPKVSSIHPIATQSPSGLFTKRAWERSADVFDESGLGDRRDGADRDRHFALWVHAEAKALATRLDRLARTSRKDDLSSNLEAVADSLWADAEWARHLADGSLADESSLDGSLVDEGWAEAA